MRKHRLEVTYNPGKAWAIRSERALATVNIAEIKAGIVNRILDKVGSLPPEKLTPFLREVGGWPELIHAEIGPEPAHTANELGFIEEDAWYVWKHLIDAT